MPDDLTQSPTLETPAQANVAPPAPAGNGQPGNSTVSQDVLNRLDKERREANQKASDLEKRLADMEQRLRAQGQTHPPVKTEPAAAAPQQNAETLPIEKQIQIRDAISDLGLTLSKGQRQVLLSLAQVEKPADVEAWVKARATDLGISTGSGTATAAQSTAAPPPAAPSPGSVPGSAPAGQMLSRLPDDMNTWKGDQLDRWHAERGLTRRTQKATDELMAEYRRQMETRARSR